MFTRFDVIHKRDGQTDKKTDRQTDGQTRTTVQDALMHRAAINL